MVHISRYGSCGVYAQPMNIIIVRYKNPEVEEKCIESVKRLTNLKKHRLTVFDNGPENINLGRLWNRLIKEAKDEVICLLNSDTEVEESWEKIENTAMLPGVGAVGPVTDNCKTEQKGMEKDGSVIEVDDLSGFCYIFRKSVWREVGGFPEDFPFYGQETAFNRLLQKHGYKLMVDRRVFVHHEGSSSLKNSGMDEALERKKGAERYKRFLKEI